MKYLTMIAVVLFPFCAYSTDYTETKKLEIFAKGIDSTIIECGPGSLKVKGAEGADTIQVTAEIELRNIEMQKLNQKGDVQKYIEDYFILTLEKSGREAILTSKIEFPFPALEINFIHLDVTVPKNMSININNRSGPIEITGLIGYLEINDILGSIDIKDVIANMFITDGDGHIVIQNANGDVSITDGAGDIHLQNIGGTINIVDGLGLIDIQGVSGNVTVTDGAGDINIDGVDKDVNILRAGGGDLNIKNVKGKIVRPDTKKKK